MPTSDTELAQQIAALRASYRQKLSPKVDEIVDSWRRGPSGLDELRDRAHQLAGTAATFGFVEVGRAAAAIEARLVSHADRGGPLSDRETTEIERAIAELRVLTEAP